jgi:hypothetical protein
MFGHKMPCHVWPCNVCDRLQCMKWYVDHIKDLVIHKCWQTIRDRKALIYSQGTSREKMNKV